MFLSPVQLHSLPFSLLLILSHLSACARDLRLILDDGNGHLQRQGTKPRLTCTLVNSCWCRYGPLDVNIHIRAIAMDKIGATRVCVTYIHIYIHTYTYILNIPPVPSRFLALPQVEIVSLAGLLYVIALSLLGIMYMYIYMCRATHYVRCRWCTSCSILSSVIYSQCECVYI